MADDLWAEFRVKPTAAPESASAPSPAPAEDQWAAFRAKPEAAPAPERASGPAPAPAPPAPAAGSEAAAVGRGLLNGVPVVGPYLLGGVNRAAAAVRALQNGTTFPEELKNVEAFGEATAKENPWSSTGGELVGGVLGTAPLVAAAPAAFGAGVASLPVRMLASGASGATLGAADSAVRSDGDAGAAIAGAGWGAALGAAGPAVGAGVGKAVGAFTSRGRSNGVVQEALEGISEKDLESAQFLIQQARNLPGGGVALTLDEALNAVTGGQATRASQLARVVSNSGGEGGRIMNEVYAARPASVENVGKSAFDRVAPPNLKPTELGFDVQDAARAGISQTPEGQALSAARAAQAERITPEQAGQAIQTDLGGVRALREAARDSRANVDYRLAREAPETVGIERMVAVERPGEPIITRPEGAPRFSDAAPRPMDPPPVVEASAAAGPESLARFVARHGGLRLDGDVVATDLHRFNIPGMGNVAREGGKGIDNFWRERLIEAGYFRPDADGGAARDITNELLRKLQNEQRGVPSFPVDDARQAAAARGRQGQVTDEFRAAQSQAESSLDEALSRAGVPPESLSPEIRSRTVGALMRGEHVDPLEAYERTVGAMVEPPAPYVKSTTVTEEIPDVRFGQVDPRPALAAVAEQGRTAKGDVRGSLGSFGRDLRAPDGEIDLSVAGNLKARERQDMRIKRAQEFGDGTKVRDLTITRNALDEQLKRVPEVAVADANYARNSVPLAPFERPNAPLNRITARENAPGREPGPFRTPAEQVPEAITGPTALREALANGSAATREAAERRLSTQILDAVTDAKGDVSAETLRKAMRENADVLDQMPALRDRLSHLVVAREGMARVEASPLGRIAQRPDVKSAISVLFPSDPLANSQEEIRSAVQALARNNPHAARDMVRIYMETVFNEATQETKGIAKQYGGAGFASAIRGNGQQRHNLEAAIRALPEGDTLWTGLDRMLTTLEATGYRPQKGSDTAFNQAIQARLKEGKGTVGQAINDVVSGAVAGATVGGPSGALGGALVGGRRGGSKVLQERRVLKDSEAIARILTDPRALSMIRSLSRQEPGSRSAEVLTSKLIQIGGRGLSSASQSSASPTH
ncbi:hypothetical protein [Methylorubrum extorquens]|uniref:Uncharacterized protein n=1 Tax=Methylorubrum extorquens TaxID=408 RepID=A0AAX3WFT5_METEX|nr:hypothetical protein [Methylorubrum extorquens]WHQ69475.1 hypothetical protein KEC54_24565 [Methylorubrum extorquens]